MRAVILAGGKGKRLTPYTTIFPKPLMPIDDIPIIEIIVKQLRHYGITDITIAVGHLGELIMAFLGNGEKYKVKISYSKENEPLGTAGPLSLIKGLDETFMVLNGDLLTTLDYLKLIKYHKLNSPLVTVGTYNREYKIELGVLKVTENGEIKNYIEKPINKYQVSMGIYIFEPAVLKYISKDKKMDFPELIKTLISNKEKVISYPCKDFWLDIGMPQDYEAAIKEFKKNKNLFIKEV
ncbi:NTP transferase domain-containing protein [bacterium]|nr:NTP transferase domain-containing protein [bacterium]